MRVVPTVRFSRRHEERPGSTSSTPTARAGDKLLPETMGGGLPRSSTTTIDGDPDLLLVNGRPTGRRPRPRQEGYADDAAVPQRRQGPRSRTSTEASRPAPATSFYGTWGLPSGTYDYDGDPDIYLMLTAIGPNAPLRERGTGASPTWTEARRRRRPTDRGMEFGLRRSRLRLATGTISTCSSATTSSGRRDRPLELTTGSRAWDRAYGPPDELRRERHSVLYRNAATGRSRTSPGAPGIRRDQPCHRGAEGQDRWRCAPCDVDDDGFLDSSSRTTRSRTSCFHNRGGHLKFEESRGRRRPAWRYDTQRQRDGRDGHRRRAASQRRPGGSASASATSPTR